MSNTKPLTGWRKMLFAFLILFAMVSLGCSSADYRIEVMNNSGIRLNDVGVTSNEKTFTYGVLADRGLKGFGNANGFFGTNLPQKVDVGFTPVDGEPILVEEVALPRLSGSRSIVITINEDFEVTAANE